MARMPSANPYVFRPMGGEVDPWGVGRAGLNRQQDILARDKRMPDFFRRAATAGVTAGLGATAAPLVFGASGAAAGAAGASGGAAPAAVTAGRFTLPSILKMAEIGIPAVTGLIGMRSQNRALDRQSQLEQQALAEQMAYAREQEAIRRQEAERMFAEDQRRWEAEERNRARELSATEEERAYQRRLLDEREARRAPYRRASQDALFRLQDILSMGRRG